MLGVVEFAGAAGVFPEDVVDVFEGLFEHVWERETRKPSLVRLTAVNRR